MKKLLTKRYRPERHYMRGCGPMWLERHGGGIDGVALVMDDPPRRQLSTQLLFPACAALARLDGSAEHGRSNMKKFLTTLATIHEDA